MSTWERLECMARSVDLDGGLEARLADPLWMLARQWQVSEFRGDDASQPAAVRLNGQNLRLAGLTGLSGERHPLPDSTPLETAVETTPGADFGAAGLQANVRAGRRLMHLLRQAGLDKAIDPLRARFPIQLPDRRVQLGPTGGQIAALLARRGLDAAALAAAGAQAYGKALEGILTSDELTQAGDIRRQWLTWYQARDGVRRSLAWDEQRLEYTFKLDSGGASGVNPARIELEAPEHHGGHLDWFSFNLLSSDLENAKIQTRAQTSLPIPVRYAGMPAARWWQFEDGSVNFGDLEAGPADLARLLIAEFAATYSIDWFMVPLTVPVGSLTRVEQLEVIDNFNERHRILSTAANDARRSGGQRAWRLFELTGDEVSKDHPSPWLLVAPTLASEVNGPILERVQLRRDEGANLVWAIEGLVEGLLGRSVDRADAWFAAQPSTQLDQPTGPSPATTSGRTYEAQSWRYQIETPIPAWWIPFLPELIKPDDPQVRLRRGRMQAWDLIEDENLKLQVGPQGLFLDPQRPCRVNEEEVPNSGVLLERRWQFGRWHDGSYHVWLQRRKFSGRGLRSSGLRWDLLLPAEETET